MKEMALEWFYKQLGFDESMYVADIHKLYNQAKEMEKQQIQDAFDRGIQEQTVRVFINNSIIKTPEQYYNEIYK